MYEDQNSVLGKAVFEEKQIPLLNSEDIQKQLTTQSSQLNELSNQVDSNTSSLAEITNQVDGNTSSLAAIRAAGIASPAGTYADLAALIAANPDHSKIYITLDDGNWCYHNGTAFVAGGVYQATERPLDTTLSVSGMAADAKVTGDKVGELESALGVITDTAIIEVETSGYINTNVAVGSTVDLTPVSSSYYKHAVFNISEGDILTINGQGGSTAKLFAFLDNSNTLITSANIYTEVSNFVLTAPKNSAKCVINLLNTAHGMCYLGVRTPKADVTLNSKGNSAESQITGYALGVIAGNFIDGYYIATSGSTVDITSPVLSGHIYNSSYSYCIMDCAENDVFTIAGKGGGTPRLWCFIDSSGNKLDGAIANAEANGLVIKAPANSAKLVLNNTDSNHIHYCFKGITPKVLINNVNQESIFTNDRLGLKKSTFNSGYITTKNINQTIDTTPVANSNYAHAITQCTKGQPFFIKGTPSNNSGQRLYVFTDSNYKCLYRHNDPSAANNLQIYAPADGYLIVNVLVSSDYYLYSGLYDYLSLKTSIDNITRKPFTTLPNLLGVASYRQLGSLSKGYIIMMTDDGDVGLATTTIPLAIQKEVPFTFALMKKSDIFDDDTYTATLIDAIENHGCSVAQHGDNLWSRMTEEELNAYFDAEAEFFTSKGITLHGAVIPAHDTNELAKAVCGGRFGIVRSGYSGRIYESNADQHSITNYYSYYTSGERSNLFGLSSYNCSTATDSYNQEAIDYAYANNKVVICYFHENAMDATKWQRVSDMIDYAKAKGLTFITLGDLPYVL